MKLYYGVNACSLAVLIAATEAGIPLDLVKVDIYHAPHTLPDGSDYAAINPKLYVPVLEFDDGSRLTELAVQVQYLADLVPESGLTPSPTSMERYRLQEWLNYIATEIHKSFSPWLFHPEVGPLAQDTARAKITIRLGLIEERLAAHDYLMADFTVADGYLFTVLGWSKFAKVPLADFPGIQAWQARIAARPAVQDAVRRHV